MANEPGSASLAGRLAAVFVASVLVEAIRYYIHPTLYLWVTWVLVGSSIGLNFAYHLWSLPNSYPRVLVSAFYNQTALPYVAIYMWELLKKLIPPLPQSP